MIYSAGDLKQECKPCGYVYEQQGDTEDDNTRVVQGDEPFLKVEGAVVMQFDTHWRYQEWEATKHSVIACPRCGAIKVKFQERVCGE
jgi:rubredoxin